MACKGNSGRLARVDQSHGGACIGRERRGMDDDRRHMTSHGVLAMSGSAIMGRCTVTCYRGSRGKEWRGRWGRIKERPKGTRGEGEGSIVL